MKLAPIFSFAKREIDGKPVIFKVNAGTAKFTPKGAIYFTLGTNPNIEYKIPPQEDITIE